MKLLEYYKRQEQYWQRKVNYSLYIKAQANHKYLVSRRDWYREAYHRQYSVVFQ